MPQQPGAMRNRWTAYAGVSAALAAGVIVKSLAQRPNFYSAAVYLSQSNANLMILCNLVFVTACSVILFLQRMLYGPLRPIEIEQLYEKAWFAVTETCLAMTIFRGEIGAWFLVMFFSLLAGKVWGWIGEGRVEVLEQQQHNILGGGNARLFHTRLAASLALSVLFDLTMLEYVVGQVLHMARPDMMVMFGFEFAVLSVTSLSTAMRYGLNLVEIGIVRKQKQQRTDAIRKSRIDAAVQQIRNRQASTQAETTPATDSAELTQRIAEASQNAAAQPIDEAEVEVEGWEGKGRWTFYLDLATDFFKLVIYLSFFFILLIFYGLPLHIMRDVFLTCRSFFKRISDFMRYRTATRDMNERYPDATETEIGREDVCIICREEMRPYVPPAPGQPRDPLVERMRPKKLPCGHVLHFSCLRSWLERQQICPTCRATVVPRPQGRSGTAAAPGAAAHPANRGNPRPRVFQFGPLRIGVGAARGNNMMEELDQQLGNIDQADQGDGNLPQQYGFGIRWGGARRRPHGQRRRGTIEDQLNSAERQIQREVDALQASMGELQALRNVQAQLARIRMARQGTSGTATPVAAVPVGQTRTLAPVTTTVNALTHDQHQPILQAGTDRLPPGLTLPEGWTMMPLQPVPASQIPPPPPIVPHLSNGLRMPQLGGEVAQTANINIGGPNMGLPTDLQTLIHGAQETARRLAQPDPASNGAQPSDPRPPQLPQLPTSHPTLSPVLPNIALPVGGGPRIPDTTNAIAGSASSTSSTSVQVPTSPRQGVEPSESSRRIAGGQAGSRSQSDSQRPSQSAPSARTVTVAVPQPRVVAPSSTVQAQSEPQRRMQPPPPTRTTPTVSRASVPSPPSQPPRLNPSTANGIRQTSPHRPTRSIGSSWGFSGVEKDDDTGDDEDDEEDEDKDSSSDDDDENDEGKKSAASGLVKNKGKTPTVEDLGEDPD